MVLQGPGWTAVRLWVGLVQFHHHLVGRTVTSHYELVPLWPSGLYGCCFINLVVVLYRGFSMEVEFGL